MDRIGSMTFIIFIIVIGVLVLVHEFGHFIFAKRAGMKVEEFGFGFPPKLFSFKKGETSYSINLIPFGGFVKILGEDGDNRENPRSFGAKPFWARFKVIIAGVAMNFLLAAVLLMIGNTLGLRVGLTDDKVATARDQQVQIIQVAKGSPAESGDLRVLDEIVGLRVGGDLQKISSLDGLSKFISENPGKEIIIVIKRGDTLLDMRILPRVNPPAGEGPLGISLALTGEVKYLWYEAIWRGLYDAGILFINTVYGYFLLFKTLLTQGKLLSEVSGPIGIATLTGQAAKISINYLMQFVAVISMNLAVLNIIPFPALDGGRLAFLVIEKLRGAPLNKKIEGLVNAVGFSLLIALMIYVTIKDVGRFL